jgi:UDP-glucose 4-epimerase
MKKYVITGGAGFIGSHIAEYLSAEGHQIIVLDSLRTGFKKNLDDLNVQFEKGDIRDKNLVEELVRRRRTRSRESCDSLNKN